MKEDGFGGICGASLLWDGNIINDNGTDSQSSLDQAACTKIAFMPI